MDSSGEAGRREFVSALVVCCSAAVLLLLVIAARATSVASLVRGGRRETGRLEAYAAAPLFSDAEGEERAEDLGAARWRFLSGWRL